MKHDIPGTLVPSNSLMECVCVCGHRTGSHFFDESWFCTLCIVEGKELYQK